MYSILICRVEQPSGFTTPLVLMRPRHYAAYEQAQHIARYTYLCQFFLSRFVDLTLANTREDGSTILWHKPAIRCQISNPVFLVFHDNSQHHLKYILLLLQFELLLHCKVLRQAGYFQACISLQQKCQAPQCSSIAQGINIREEHFRKHMLYVRHHISAALPYHLRAIAMFAFTQ